MRYWQVRFGVIWSQLWVETRVDFQYELQLMKILTKKFQQITNNSHFFNAEELNSLENQIIFENEIFLPDIFFQKLFHFSKLFNSSELKKISVIGCLSCNSHPKWSEFQFVSCNWRKLKKCELQLMGKWEKVHISGRIKARSLCEVPNES